MLSGSFPKGRALSSLPPRLQKKENRSASCAAIFIVPHPAVNLNICGQKAENFPTAPPLPLSVTI